MLGIGQCIAIHIRARHFTCHRSVFCGGNRISRSGWCIVHWRNIYCNFYSGRTAIAITDFNGKGVFTCGIWIRCIAVFTRVWINRHRAFAWWRLFRISQRISVHIRACHFTCHRGVFIGRDWIRCCRWRIVHWSDIHRHFNRRATAFAISNGDRKGVFTSRIGIWYIYVVACIWIKAHRAFARWGLFRIGQWVSINIRTCHFASHRRVFCGGDQSSGCRWCIVYWNNRHRNSHSGCTALTVIHRYRKTVNTVVVGIRGVGILTSGIINRHDT